MSSAGQRGSGTEGQVGGHGTETAPHEPVFRGERLARLQQLFTLYPRSEEHTSERV